MREFIRAFAGVFVCMILVLTGCVTVPTYNTAGSHPEDVDKGVLFCAKRGGMHNIMTWDAPSGYTKVRVICRDTAFINWTYWR